jgi:hypothetical protein
MDGYGLIMAYQLGYGLVAVDLGICGSARVTIHEIDLSI